MKEDIKARLMKILSQIEEIVIPIEEIRREDDLTLIGVDSRVFIKLIILIENEFNVSFDDDLDMDAFSTLDDLIPNIENKLKAK
jgi:acyl carrier protein